MKIKKQSTKTLKEGIFLARCIFVIIYFILIFLVEIVNINIRILILLIFILSMCERWMDRNVIMLEIRDNKRW